MKHPRVTRLRCAYRVQELSMTFWTARSNGWSDDGGCCTMNCLEQSWICQPAPTDSRRCIDNIEGTLLPSYSVDRADQAHLSFVPERCRALVSRNHFSWWLLSWVSQQSIHRVFRPLQGAAFTCSDGMQLVFHRPFPDECFAFSFYVACQQASPVQRLHSHTASFQFCVCSLPLEEFSDSFIVWP